jgi:predicted secreted Zn-dependent protease
MNECPHCGKVSQLVVLGLEMVVKKDEDDPVDFCKVSDGAGGQEVHIHSIG